MIAVIDIGSNSVRLMLWADGKALYKRVRTTRLGEGVASGMLEKSAIARTAEAVKAFADEAFLRGAKVYAFATAAVRSAKNADAFCGEIFARTGLRVDVVPGKEEALLGLFGVWGAEDGGIVDVGGASTEICVRSGGHVSAVSVDLGAVRLFDACGDDREKLSRYIDSTLSKTELPVCKVRLAAIGGTASTLASLKLGLREYDAARIQDLPLKREEISALADKLFSLSLEERKKLPGMDVRRADILGGGALLLLAVLDKLSIGKITVSDRDNLEGYLRYKKPEKGNE